jgi:RimJ/RimL family protein N-acetyltransferase
MNPTTTVKILQPGDEAALEAFLLPRVDSSMFLIGNMRAAGLADHGQTYQGSYAAAVEAGQMTGVAAHYWNGNLILQAPAHLEQLWPAAVQASGRPVRGLIGPAGQVEAVKTSLGIEPDQVQLDETENLYSLDLADLVEPEAFRSGRVRGRRIAPADLELVIRWRIEYSLETLGADDTPELRESCRASIERSLQEGSTWLLEDGGQPVACTSFNTAIAEAVQVGGVWTPPELRGRGYARCVVAASLRDARAEGVNRAILFTGKQNLPAQKAYLALGFRQIGDYRLLLLNRPMHLPGSLLLRN